MELFAIEILEEVCVLFGTNYHFEIKKKVSRNSKCVFVYE